MRELVGRVPDFGGSVPAVLRQPKATYWSIFDAKGRAEFFVSGSGWDDTNNVQREIFANPRMSEWVKQTNSIAGLAQATGMPEDTLVQSVKRWNAMIAEGEDTEWRRFGRSATNLHAIDTPPFYAIQHFPLSRKSMGGVAVDLSCLSPGTSKPAMSGHFKTSQGEAGFSYSVDSLRAMDSDGFSAVVLRVSRRRFGRAGERRGRMIELQARVPVGRYA